MLNTKEDGKVTEGKSRRKGRFYTSETLMVAGVIGIAEERLLPGGEFELLWVPFIQVKAAYREKGLWAAPSSRCVVYLGTGYPVLTEGRRRRRLLNGRYNWLHPSI
jgi:hypothetical protein